MIEQDTIRLLKECDAGVKMGIASFEDVMDSVQSQQLRNILQDNKTAHEHLLHEVEKSLQKYHDDGKQPDPLAKGMSWMKTKVMLMMHENDATIADLMSDGAAMGVKSLAKYLNQYKAADRDSKNIAKKIIELEESLIKDIQPYL